MGITLSQNLNNAIYTAINNSVGSNNPGGKLVGIYELQAPQDAQLPNCTFQIITDEVTQGLSKSINEDIELQVNFYGYTKSGSKALRTISDELYSELSRAVLNITGAGGVVNGVTQGITTIEEDGNIFNIRQIYKIIVV